VSFLLHIDVRAGSFIRNIKRKFKHPSSGTIRIDDFMAIIAKYFINQESENGKI
jgi:hypothetical protein